jgi:hypothetical protein
MFIKNCRNMNLGPLSSAEAIGIGLHEVSIGIGLHEVSIGIGLHEVSWGEGGARGATGAIGIGLHESYMSPRASLPPGNFM